MSSQTLTQMLEAILSKYQGLSLSAKDNQKLLASVLALEAIEAQGVEAQLWGESHLLLKASCAGSESLAQVSIWIDCGVSRAYQASYKLLPADIEIDDCQTVEVPLLDEHRIALMCMQSAHFDHCY
ncbi:hypothetical protein L2725_07225 [Shewanella corallii]|uniref:Uncharacterized protein n=1 Tax=Shewanella corallii TaxID=560080 RepID=A0ABT0N588_9GAMM|nr:hypothetical protein [Shewanella corallii]MCL2913579.1 hypothetical protein [Shewanella corallii]